MRLWSLHPKYLDTKGLVAVWREALLAQSVLAGKTKGYLYHPQLQRFKTLDNPLGAIALYLLAIANEAEQRNFNFQKNKINLARYPDQIAVTSNQISYESRHLLNKLNRPVFVGGSII